MGSKCVEVDIYLDDFTDGELLDELEARGLKPEESQNTDLLNTMYEKYRANQPIDAELRQLFFSTIGRIA